MMNLSDISTDDPMSFGTLKIFDCTIHALHQGAAHPIVLSTEEDYAESIVPGRWDWLIKGDPAKRMTTVAASSNSISAQKPVIGCTT